MSAENFQAHHLIHDLAVVLSVAAVTTVVFRKLKQPVVLGYLLAGMIDLKLFVFSKDFCSERFKHDIGMLPHIRIQTSFDTNMPEESIPIDREGFG